LEISSDEVTLWSEECDEVVQTDTKNRIRGRGVGIMPDERVIVQNEYNVSRYIGLCYGGKQPIGKRVSLFCRKNDANL
jgi:hypothetical protein